MDRHTDKMTENQTFLLDHTFEMAMMFDGSGIINYANRETKENLKYGDGSEEYYISDIFPNHFTKTEDGFETDLRLGQDVQVLMAYRKNRTCFKTEARFFEIGENPNLFLCLARDTSQSDFMEKELAKVNSEAGEADKVKSEFVANVTHELRTPVNGILGNTKELQALEDNPEKIRILGLIERGCRDMNQIINNILDFSKLEAGKFTLEKRKFSFYNMIDYIKSNHKNKIVEKGLDFFVTVAPDIPEYIVGDELRICQIVNNLLANACKFTSIGKITLEVAKTAQVGNRMELFFIVTDTGIGINKVDQDKLFKSFSQVDATISRKYGGTGLGLNICKQLVEMMEGTIHVASEVNRGSIFTFSISVELPEEEVQKRAYHADVQAMMEQVQNQHSTGRTLTVNTFGTDENLEEIEKLLMKTILSIEMGNWEKAEMFAEPLRKLVEEAPKEIKTGMLKLKMAIQKEDYEKSIAAAEHLKEKLAGLS